MSSRAPYSADFAPEAHIESEKIDAPEHRGGEIGPGRLHAQPGSYRGSCSEAGQARELLPTRPPAHLRGHAGPVRAPHPHRPHLAGRQPEGRVSWRPWAAKRTSSSWQTTRSPSPTGRTTLEIVKRTSILRDLIRASGEIDALAYDAPDDLGVVVEEAEKTLFNVTEKRVSSRSAHGHAANDAFEELRSWPSRRTHGGRPQRASRTWTTCSTASAAATWSSSRPVPASARRRSH